MYKTSVYTLDIIQQHADS